MDHLDLPQFLGLLVAILAAAKLFGALAQLDRAASRAWRAVRRSGPGRLRIGNR